MNPLRGIGLKIASVIVFALMIVCIKASAPQVPPGQSVFFRSFFAIPVIVAWQIWHGDLRNGFRTNNLIGHVWRGVIGTSAMGFGFAAVGLLPLPEATAIGYASPLLTVIFAALLLGEKVRIFRLGAVMVGMIGVLIVVAPRLSPETWASGGSLQTIGALCGLFGALSAALAHVLVRKLVHTESTSAIVFYVSVSGALIGLMTLPFGWAMPDTAGLALLIGAGLLGGVGQILLTMAYRNAEAGVIAPFDYASMLLALTFGYVLFNEVPTAQMLAGGSLIVASGIFIIWRERQLGIARAEARKVTPPPQA